MSDWFLAAIQPATLSPWVASVGSREMPPHERTPAEDTLSVELAIAPASGCPVVATGRTATEITARQVEGICRCDVVVRPPGGTVAVARSRSLVGPGCPCPVFDDFDLVPKIVAVEDDGFVVRTFVSDRATLSSLVAGLKRGSHTVRLRRISETALADRDTVHVSLESLTPTQRETIEAAVDAGYYASPRGTTLGELAASHGISKSAMSRRLQAAERKLVDEVFPGDGSPVGQPGRPD